MPKYAVTVRYEMERVIMVYGANEDVAKERAEAVVSDWKDVRSAEAQDAEEQ